MPHDEDTGGFFVATFRKLNPHTNANTIAETNAIAVSNMPVKRELESQTDDSVVTKKHIHGNITTNNTDDGTVAAVTTVTTESTAVTEVKPEAAAAEAAATSSNTNNNTNNNTNKTNIKMTTKGLVDFKEWDSDVYQKINSFYGFTSHINQSMFMVREDFQYIGKQASVSAKSIYFIPPAVSICTVVDTMHSCGIIIILYVCILSHGGVVQLLYSYYYL